MQICQANGITAPTYAALSAICHRLGAMRLLLVEPSWKDITQRILLNYAPDELTFGLVGDEVLEAVLQQHHLT